MLTDPKVRLTRGVGPSNPHPWVPVKGGLDWAGSLFSHGEGSLERWARHRERKNIIIRLSRGVGHPNPHPWVPVKGGLDWAGSLFSPMAKGPLRGAPGTQNEKTSLSTL